MPPTPPCVQSGRVWTCGGSPAFAFFSEWTQQGVLLGSQFSRLTGKRGCWVLPA